MSTRRWSLRGAALAGLLAALLVVGAAGAATSAEGPKGKGKGKAPGVAQRSDAQTGAPRSYLGRGAPITGPSSASPEQTALGFVAAHRSDYGLTPSQLDQLEIVRSYSSKSGTRHVLVGQRIDGARVEGSGLMFLLDRAGAIVSVQGTLATGRPSGERRLDARHALTRAAALSGKPLGSARPIESRGAQLRFENTLAEGLRGAAPLTAEPVWFAADHGRRLVAAWVTDAEVSGTDWHLTVIDASTGAVLKRTSRSAHAGPEGTVFREQTPIAAGATRQVTAFSGLDGSWVSGDVTDGNNVTAYRDLQNTNTVGYQPSNADQHFHFTWTDDWRTDMDADDESLNADLDAAITQLFYYTNVMHDWLYGYGFDEPSGNFQVDNFDRDGEEGDPVNAEAQDGWDFGCVDDDVEPPVDIRCRNNANFNTPADGNRPRMQMYMFDGDGNWNWADGSMDGDVIAHEYGHGVSNRLVGDGDGALSTFEAQSLGEGWSDAISFLKWEDSVVGEYVTDSPNTGVRSVNYASSNLVYSDYNPNANSPHPNGEIWASVMYDIRAAKGITFTAQLLLDGMKATTDDPTMLDARDGIIAADTATNGAANYCLLWGIFAAREMGFSATSFNNVATDVPAECQPTADAGGPYVTPEGTDATLDASDSEEASHASGGSLTYAWDLDNDDQYDDAAGVTAAFSTVGQDGVFTIGLQVTDTVTGITDTDTTTVTVTNVPPTVQVQNNGPVTENSPVTVSGVVSDAGWLESPLTATIDWGDGSAAAALTGVVEEIRPFKTITFSAQHTYGDNGVFTVTVCGKDDDAPEVCNSTNVTVTNVNPTATIDAGATGAIDVNGQQAVVVHIGDDVPFTGRSTDPGSDDLTLTWDWSDGPPAPDSSTTYFNNAPTNTPDPFPSPQVNPRDVTDESVHAFAKACLYEVVFDAHDDDGGSADADSLVVIVTGLADVERNAGYWQTQYRPRPTAFDEETRLCYLAIAGFMSQVFSELRDASTVPAAFDVLSVKQNGGTPLEQLDRQILAAWLNFANGVWDLDELVDADSGKGVDTPFATVMAAAEAVRLNPASTAVEIYAQRDILERINGK